nr:glutamic acid-rich protein-like [Aegilops tauschii subsp. strangulata]
MAGEEGSEQKEVTAEETSSSPTQQTSSTDGVRTPERCTTEPQAEAQIEEPVSEPQAEAEDQEGYDDEEADLDYQDDADYDGYDDDGEDDYEYGSESDYDSEYEDEDDYDWESEFAKHRPVVRETLLNFPEAANLEPQELDAAVERVLEQSKPEYRDVTAPGKVRLLKNDIRLILAEKWEPPNIHKLPSIICPLR